MSKKWYVVHAYSGFEKNVARALKERVELSSLGEHFGEILVPTEEVVEMRGGQKRQWPTIHRWVYPAFTVYFEKSKVIDVVANQADADEIGPKPPIR